MKNLTQITGADKRYFINPKGEIYFKKRITLRRKEPLQTTKGYLSISIRFDGKMKRCHVHRLVAMQYIPNPDNKPFTNHKNGIKTDNRVENLEWCTVSENNTHSCYILGNDSQYAKRPVVAFKNGVQILLAPSVRLMAKQINGKHPNISQVCRGKRKTYLGYQFRYAS